MNKLRSYSFHFRTNRALRRTRRGVALLVTLASVFGFASLSSPSLLAQTFPPHAKKGKPEALILGDSVTSILGVGDQGLIALNKLHRVVYGAHGCQLLLLPGCIAETKESALKVFRGARGKFSDVVIVTTGYNEFDDRSLVDAIRKFKAEAKRQKVSLVWLTYRENGNVKEKSKRFNSILRKAAAKDPKFLLYDWNEFTLGKTGWYSGDQIHMSLRGGLHLAKYIGRIIREVVLVRKTKTESTATTTPALAP